MNKKYKNFKNNDVAPKFFLRKKKKWKAEHFPNSNP